MGLEAPQKEDMAKFCASSRSMFASIWLCLHVLFWFSQMTSSTQSYSSCTCRRRLICRLCISTTCIAENCWVMQVKSHQPIVLFCKQIKRKWLPMAGDYLTFPCKISAVFLKKDFSLLFDRTSCHNHRPSDRVQKKMENYAEISGNIMRRKVTIMQKRWQIMRKFLKIIKLFPWLFSNV